MANYLPDLEKFSLEQFKNRLAGQEMLPSRKILQEDLEARFTTIQAEGIETLAELITSLKTKKKAAAFAVKTGLPEDYLIILRREANSYLPKAVNLAQFPGVPDYVAAKLAKVGIRHSHDLIEHCQTAADRAVLAEQADLSASEMLELLYLSDLVRINGVGPVFARMLVDAGIKTNTGLAQAEDGALYSLLKALNYDRGYTKVDFTQKDMAYCIELAGTLPPAAKY